MTRTHPLTEAETLAEAAGVVLGAASQCEEVTQARLSAAAAKLRQVVIAAAADEADAKAATERFSIAVEAGKSAAETGKIDPEAAETALSEMEEQLSA
jgi:hypothetical protein